VCHGTGVAEQHRRLQVDIPAGVDNDMRIRLSGEGEVGGNGGPSGNLYVVLHVQPHRYFQRRETDILLNIDVNIAQAALGDELTVPGLEGDETLIIPPGTQPGAVFRLRGKGVPRLRGSGRGDQIIMVNVAVPTHLSEDQRRLFAELGATLGENIKPQREKGLMDRFREALGL
jgi:molecular chaperone DnaJ